MSFMDLFSEGINNLCSHLVQWVLQVLNTFQNQDDIKVLIQFSVSQWEFIQWFLCGLWVRSEMKINGDSKLSGVLKNLKICKATGPDIVF